MARARVDFQRNIHETGKVNPRAADRSELTHPIARDYAGALLPRSRQVAGTWECIEESSSYDSPGSPV